MLTKKELTKLKRTQKPLYLDVLFMLLDGPAAYWCGRIPAKDLAKLKSLGYRVTVETQVYCLGCWRSAAKACKHLTQKQIANPHTIPNKKKVEIEYLYTIE